MGIVLNSKAGGPLLGRRWFLSGALVGGLLPRATPQSAPSPVLNLTALLPSDGVAFDSALANFFPALTAAPNFGVSIRPYLVILKNDTNLVAKGYAVRWAVQSGSGIVRNVDNYLIQRHQMPRREAKILRPGDVRLLSYYENLAPGDTPSVLPFLSGSGAVLAVALDGVVFEGGVFVGSNQSLIKERYVLTRHAEHDAGLSINRMFVSNAELNAIVSKLHDQIGSWDDDSGRNREAIYKWARSVEAGRLLSAYNRFGIAGLQAAAARRARFPREPASLTL